MLQLALDAQSNPAPGVKLDKIQGYSNNLAAALKASERATLIGETTAGKGVSQSEHTIRDEGKLWLVETAYFYPGTEDTWHETGIVPHIEIAVPDARFSTSPIAPSALAARRKPRAVSFTYTKSRVGCSEPSSTRPSSRARATTPA